MTMEQMMIDKAQIAIWDALAALGPTTVPCSHCGNLGYIGLDLPVQHEHFGRAFICICRKKEFLQRRIN